MWAWVRIPLLTNVFRKYEIANIRLVCIEFTWIPQEYSWIRVRIHCVERFRQFSKTENAHGVTPIAIFELSSGELAQMVERSLSMREVRGSMPRFSSNCFLQKTQIRHSHIAFFCVHCLGELAQMVERSIRIREPLGSIPGFSNYFLHDINVLNPLQSIRNFSTFK